MHVISSFFNEFKKCDNEIMKLPVFVDFNYPPPFCSTSKHIDASENFQMSLEGGVNKVNKYGNGCFFIKKK